jgi:uncharacterized protein (DUF2267 family)
MERDELLERVREEAPFDVTGGTPAMVAAVTHAIRAYVTDGEWNDVTSSLPHDLVSLLASS